MNRDINYTSSLERQLRWRVRRGLRELDLILSNFLDIRLAELDDVLLHQLLALLECKDGDLYAWLVLHVPCKVKQLQPIISAICHPGIY